MLTVNPEFEIRKKFLFQSSVYSAHTSTQELFPKKALMRSKLLGFCDVFNFGQFHPGYLKKKTSQMFTLRSPSILSMSWTG